MCRNLFDIKNIFWCLLLMGGALDAFRPIVQTVGLRKIRADLKEMADASQRELAVQKAERAEAEKIKESPICGEQILGPHRPANGRFSFGCSEKHVFHAQCLEQHGAARVSQGFMPNCPICRAVPTIFFDAFMQAVRAGSVGLVGVLMERGIEINQRDSSGHTALMEACVQNSMPMVTFLVEHGADVNVVSNAPCVTPLCLAMQTKNYVMITYLLEHGAHPNIRVQGITPLCWAVAQGDIEMVRILLDHGASVNLVDDKGISPLGYAVGQRDVPMVDFLADHGADVNCPVGRDKRSLLIVAAYKLPLPMVMCLVKHGAQLDIRNEIGISAWRAAVLDCNSVTAQYLHQCGARVSPEDMIHVATSLMLAKGLDDTGKTEVIKSIFSKFPRNIS